jgi:hypothetical protein
MWNQDVYVAEKLKEFDAASPRRSLPPVEPRRPRKRLLAPIASRAGHRIRHLGEALEAWAAPAPRSARG